MSPSCSKTVEQVSYSSVDQFQVYQLRCQRTSANPQGNRQRIVRSSRNVSPWAGRGGVCRACALPCHPGFFTVPWDYSAGGMRWRGSVPRRPTRSSGRTETGRVPVAREFHFDLGQRLIVVACHGWVPYAMIACGVLVNPPHVVHEVRRNSTLSSLVSMPWQVNAELRSIYHRGLHRGRGGWNGPQ